MRELPATISHCVQSLPPSGVDCVRYGQQPAAFIDLRTILDRPGLLIGEPTERRICHDRGGTMAIERIQPDGLSRPPTYSQVVKAGNTIYVAGQVSQDEHGQLVGAGDFVAQATQVFENLRKALAAAGAGFENLVKTNVYVT